VSSAQDKKKHTPTILSHTLLYIKTSIKSNKNADLFIIFQGNFAFWRFFSYGAFRFIPIFTIFTKNSPCARTARGGKNGGKPS
jgi:hypothetical protein